MSKYIDNKTIKVLQSPLYFLLVSVTSIFLAELLTRAVFPLVSFGLLKAFIITLFVSPVFIVFIYYPFRKYINQRNKSQKELIRLNFELEKNLKELSHLLEEMKEIKVYINEKTAKKSCG